MKYVEVRTETLHALNHEHMESPEDTPRGTRLMVPVPMVGRLQDAGFVMYHGGWHWVQDRNPNFNTEDMAFLIPGAFFIKH